MVDGTSDASLGTVVLPHGAPIAAMLVDSQEFVRAGLRSLLQIEPGIALIGEASSGAAALSLVAAEPFDVVLVSHELPNLLDLVSQIQHTAKGASVIVYGVPAASTILADALRYGVKGFVDQVADFSDLLIAVFAVAAGSLVIAPRFAAQLAGIASAPGRGEIKPDADPRVTLTPREREILAYVAAGVSNRGLARMIGLSEHTVRAHMRGIMRKLNAGSRVQAVSIAIQCGAIPPPLHEGV